MQRRHSRCLISALFKKSPGELGPDKGTGTVKVTLSPNSGTVLAYGVAHATAVSKKGKPISLNILIDVGANTSLVRKGTAMELGLKGKELVLSGVRGNVSKEASENVELEVTSINGEKK